MGPLVKVGAGERVASSRAEKALSLSLGLEGGEWRGSQLPASRHGSARNASPFVVQGPHGVEITASQGLSAQRLGEDDRLL